MKIKVRKPGRELKFRRPRRKKVNEGGFNKGGHATVPKTAPAVKTDFGSGAPATGFHVEMLPADGSTKRIKDAIRRKFRIKTRTGRKLR